MDDFVYKNKKIIGILVGILLLVLLGFGIYKAIWNGIYSATVNVMVAPSIAKVKIGEDTFKTSGDFRIKPGDYNVEISADGFETITLSITAAKDETAFVREYLKPLEGNENWYEEHDGDALVAGEIEYIKTNELLEKRAVEHPIISKLPVAVDYYTSDYSSHIKYDLRYEIGEDKQTITIFIDDYTGGNKNLAVERLNSFGLDLSGYKIKYNTKSSDR